MKINWERAREIALGVSQVGVFFWLIGLILLSTSHNQGIQLVLIGVAILANSVGLWITSDFKIRRGDP